ncbi:hypothetical protein ACFLQ2_01360 [archaeon]
MRGQVTFEFLGTVVVAMLIYAIFSTYIFIQFESLLPWQNQNYDARFYAEQIAEAIDYAHFGGDGYHDTFVLPEQIRSRNYTVFYSSGIIEVDIVDLGDVDSYGIAHVVAPQVGMFSVGNGTNHVVNSNGTVGVWVQ